MGVSTIGSKAESDNADVSQTQKSQNIDDQKRHQSKFSESFDRPNPVHENELFPVNALDEDEIKDKRASIRTLKIASTVLGLEEVEGVDDIDSESDDDESDLNKEEHCSSPN